MNVITPAKDLGLLRPNPQIPCPLVQPFPNRVPIPTINPAAVIANADGMGTVGSDPKRVSAANDAGNNKDVTMKLPIRDNFHTDDESVNAVLGLEKTDAMIPDAPRMSPLNNSSDAAERPIVVPPNVPMSGVKYSNAMTGGSLFVDVTAAAAVTLILDKHATTMTAMTILLL
mmetsp:Transcript_18906/g.45653  ORF Transcript_18906/g.45653 Transcript_18906/m.45653 type:complete len:172 (-) Transcript_18906:79-594(-)